ncbi:MAG TPA: ABC transporter ATP-binding protein [bacterium]
MKTVIEFWKQRPLRFVSLILYTAVATFLALVYPYILKDIIDGITARFTTAQLMRSIMLLAGIGIVRSVIGVTLPYLRGRTNEIFNLKERNSIFRRLLKQGHTFTNTFPAGDVLERIDSDLGELAWFACSGVFRPIEGLMILLFAVFFLARINWILTIFAVIPMTVTVFAFLKLSPRIYKYFMSWRELISRAHNVLQSYFSGIRIIKAYNMEDQSGRDFAGVLNERVGAATKALRVEIMTHSLFSSFEEIGIAFVLVFGGIFILNKTLTIGEFVAFNAYVLLLLRPMIDIGNFFVRKKRAEVQIKRIEEIKNFAPAVLDEGAIEMTGDKDHGITGRGIGFRYGTTGPDILKNVDHVLPQGKRIGIAGTVGSGKTTLLKLIMRIADATQGRITAGGHQIGDLTLPSYRSLYAYVPQEPSLFSDTLYNNITFGRDIDADKLQAAIEMTQLKEFVKGCPAGLEETVGERGLKLSGGEKQRVAIARAVLADPRILILDDATSNLDAATEQELITQLSTKTSMTVVIISHRLSVLSICDYIYVLDKGAVAESGTHRELIKNRGLYWKLYQYQLAEEKVSKK